LHKTTDGLKFLALVPGALLAWAVFALAVTWRLRVQGEEPGSRYGYVLSNVLLGSIPYLALVFWLLSSLAYWLFKTSI